MLIFIGVLIYSSWIFEIFLNPRLSLIQSYVSELSVNGQPNVYYFKIANLFGSTLMTVGFFVLLKQPRLNRDKYLKKFVQIMLVITIFGIFNSIFPMDCAPSESYACLVAQDHWKINFNQWIHQISAIIMFGGLIFAQFQSTFFIFRERARLFWLSLINLTIQFFLNAAICVIALFNLQNVGLFQRLSLVLFAIWVISILLYLKTKTINLPSKT